MGFFSGKKRGDDKRLELVSEALSKLPSIREQLAISEDVKKDADDFFKVMRHTFSRMFGLTYEFTYEELSADVSKKKISHEQKKNVKKLCDDLVRFEFADSSNSSRELLDIIDLFEEIITFDEDKAGKQDKKPKLTKIKKLDLPSQPKGILGGFMKKRENPGQASHIEELQFVSPAEDQPAVSPPPSTDQPQQPIPPVEDSLDAIPAPPSPTGSVIKPEAKVPSYPQQEEKAAEIPAPLPAVPKPKLGIKVPPLFKKGPAEPDRERIKDELLAKIENEIPSPPASKKRVEKVSKQQVPASVVPPPPMPAPVQQTAGEKAPEVQEIPIAPEPVITDIPAAPAQESKPDKRNPAKAREALPKTSPKKPAKTESKKAKSVNESIRKADAKLPDIPVREVPPISAPSGDSDKKDDAAPLLPENKAEFDIPLPPKSMMKVADDLKIPDPKELAPLDEPKIDLSNIPPPPLSPEVGIDLSLPDPVPPKANGIIAPGGHEKKRFDLLGIFKKKDSKEKIPAAVQEIKGPDPAPAIIPPPTMEEHPLPSFDELEKEISTIETSPEVKVASKDADEVSIPSPTSVTTEESDAVVLVPAPSASHARKKESKPKAIRAAHKTKPAATRHAKPAEERLARHRKPIEKKAAKAKLGRMLKRQESLPEFSLKEKEMDRLLTSELKEKKAEAKQSLSDILASISLDKKKVEKEYEFLADKEKLIEKERRELADLKKSAPQDYRKLPRLDKFKTEIDDRENEIRKHKELLLKKEKELDLKENMLKKLESDLGSLKLNVNDDRKKLEEKEAQINLKKDMIEKIRSDLKKENENALMEIEKFRKDLLEKQKGFLALQEYYRKRENKMSVEEANIMALKQRITQIKKSNVEFIEKNLHAHKSIIAKDIEHTNKRISQITARIKEVDKGVKEMTAKMSALSVEARELEKLSDEKREYYAKAEKDIRSKYPALSKLSEKLDADEARIIEQENLLEKMESGIAEATEKIKLRERELEAKEMDIWNLEKKGENLRLLVLDNEKEIAKRDLRLQKKIAQYKEIRETIEKTLKEMRFDNEKIKKSIEASEKRLHKKEKVAELFGEGLRYLGHDIHGMDYDIDLGDQEEQPLQDSEIHLSEITIRREMPGIQGIGSPAMLEVFRRLNIARIALTKKHDDEAKRIYQDINDIYEHLADSEKDEAYDEIVKVFAPLITRSSDRPSANQGRSASGLNDFNASMAGSYDNIDSLLDRFNRMIERKDIRGSEEIYQRIQHVYSSMSSNDKSRYYPKIMEVYNLIIGNQASNAIMMY